MEFICLLGVLMVLSTCVISDVRVQALEGKIGVYLLLVPSSNERKHLGMHRIRDSEGLGPGPEPAVSQPVWSQGYLGLSFPHLQSEEAGLDDPQGYALPKIMTVRIGGSGVIFNVYH